MTVRLLSPFRGAIANINSHHSTPHQLRINIPQFSEMKIQKSPKNYQLRSGVHNVKLLLVIYQWDTHALKVGRPPLIISYPPEREWLILIASTHNFWNIWKTGIAVKFNPNITMSIRRVLDTYLLASFALAS